MEGHFLVPDYYEDFRCSGGAAARCDGGGISVTQEEYFPSAGAGLSAGSAPPHRRGFSRAGNPFARALSSPSPPPGRAIARCAPGRALRAAMRLRRRSSARDLPPVSARRGRPSRWNAPVSGSCGARDRDADGAQRENDLPHRTRFILKPSCPTAPSCAARRAITMPCGKCAWRCCKAGAAAERAAHAPVQRAARADAASFFLPARGRRAAYPLFPAERRSAAAVPEGLDRALSYARALSRELGKTASAFLPIPPQPNRRCPMNLRGQPPHSALPSSSPTGKPSLSKCWSTTSSTTVSPFRCAGKPLRRRHSRWRQPMRCQRFPHGGLCAAAPDP